MDIKFVQELENIYDDGVKFLNTIKINNKGYVFVPALQGAHYESSNTKVMVIGRAPGEYSMHNYEGNLSDWFEKMGYLHWVYEKCNNVYSDGSEHLPSQNKSAFWQLIKKILISENVLSDKNTDNFADYIVWNNLYKIKDGGNNRVPSDKLCYSQKELMDEILSKEIEIYSPKIIIFITKRKTLDRGTQCSWFDLRDFDKTYETILNNGIKSLLFYRPEYGNLNFAFNNSCIIDSNYKNLTQIIRK